jgi:hypothetical protein
MKIKSVILFIFLSINCNAQEMYKDARTTYISLFGGPSKYLGDIGNQNNNFWKQFSVRQGTWMAGVSIKRVYSRKITLQFQYTNGTLAGADRDVTYKDKNDSNYLLFERNLDFKTNISEGSILLEVLPFQFLNKKSWLYNLPVQPFLTSGFGVFKYNPLGSYYDDFTKTTTWYELKSLHTEGQGFAEYPNRKEYKLTQMTIPYGGGFNMFLGPRNYISIGITGRKLFTDYLDDVSTTYINKDLYAGYLTNQDDIDAAKLLSDKSVLINATHLNSDGTQRGNNNKFDAFFTYYIKVGFKISGKKKKDPEFYKYDDNEICE